MSFNATRLTCFALISAFEMDSRALLLQMEEISGTEMSWSSAALARAAERYRRDHRESPDKIEHALLVDYFDFADAHETLLSNKSRLNADTREGLAAVAPLLQRLAAARNRVAHTRPMEIDDLSTVIDVSEAVWRRSKRDWLETGNVLDRLKKNPSFVLGLTVQLPSDPSTGRAHNLPVPDFDETGFFGREKELKRVKRAIMGPYPVVSILGDGGIGKTSIALKAAYELLDDESADFEAIVWVTAKSTVLTNTEIRNISGAIQDSLGMFEAAAAELGASSSFSTSGSDSAVELLEYLETFKVLLILDNLETVNDVRLRDFLLELPLGSKVLITSRIGLGIENPVKLEPLSSDESTRLLRAVCHARNVDFLRSMPDGAVRGLVRKLNGHPLYIKWLVAGVQAGKRIDELVSDDTLLLEYCMSNVFEQLSDTAKHVLQSMQVMRGARGQAEIAFLNSLGAEGIQACLLELLTTNFVVMRQSAENELEATYETSEFALRYLSRSNPVDADFRDVVASRSAELKHVGLELSTGTNGKLDPRTIDVRGPGDVPVARILRESLRTLRAGLVDDAMALCREAQILSPAYHETWRVEAVIQTARRDRYAAISAYERAQELAPRSAALGFHFGRFLIEEGEAQRGLSILQEAAKAEQPAPQLLLEIAIAHVRLGNDSSAVDTCLRLVELPQAVSLRSRVLSLGLEAVTAGADGARRQGQLAEGLEFVESGLVLVATDVEYLMPEALDQILIIEGIANELAVLSEGADYLVAKAKSFSARLRDRVRVVDPGALSRRVGKIKNLEPDRLFGFVKAAEEDYFFHRNDLVERFQWDQLKGGSSVVFRPDRNNAKGARALDLRVV